MEGKALYYRIAFKEEGEAKEDVGALHERDLKAVFEEYIGEKGLAELAFELYRLLGEKDVKAAIEKAGEFMGVKRDDN